MIDRVSLVVSLLNPGHDMPKEEVNTYAQIAGEVGESLTQKLLDNWKCIYFKIDQNKDNKPEWLKEISGKRPDFIVFTHDMQELIILDAKFRNIGKEYAALEIDELNKFRQLVNKLESMGKSVHMAFVYPVGGMNADRFSFINLEDFEKGEDTVLFNKPYKYVTKGLSFKT